MIQNLEEKLNPNLTYKQWLILALCLVFIGIGVGVCWIYLIFPKPEIFLGIYVSNVKPQIFKKAAVVTDAPYCAEVGKDILEKNGTSMDALIAVLLCMGVVLPHSMGLGGGAYIIFYNRTTGSSTVVDGREWAPIAATEDMFVNNPNSSSIGGKSIAVPGELKAYEAAHKRFGVLPWERLFEAAIKKCKTGFPVHHHLKRAIDEKYNMIVGKSLMKLITNPKTGKVYKEGEIMIRAKYARTLEAIAKNGADEFYTGNVAKQLIKDIKAENGIITLDDLKQYNANVYQAEAFDLPNGYTLYSTNSTGSGILLGFMLQTLLNFEVDSDVGRKFEYAALYYHRIIEIFKYAYSLRTMMEDPKRGRMDNLYSHLISPDFAEEIYDTLDNDETFEPSHYSPNVLIANDHGTAHVTVVDQFGNVAAATSTINCYFGSKVFSPSTGIVFNNQMDDFSSPNITNSYDLEPSLFNRIMPMMRPVSSTCPTIIINPETKDFVLSVGGSGGSKITTAVFQVISRHLFIQDTLKASIDSARIHHQLFPNVVVYEEHFPEEILSELKSIGHKVEKNKDRPSIVVAISRKEDGQLESMYDYRIGGSVAGF